MIDNTRYNGWRNYPTWCVALWLDQDKDIRNFFDADDLGARLQSASGRWELTKELAQHLRNLCEELQELTDNQASGMFSDLMTYALQQVDFEEIAQQEIVDFITETVL